MRIPSGQGDQSRRRITRRRGHQIVSLFRKNHFFSSTNFSLPVCLALSPSVLLLEVCNVVVGLALRFLLLVVGLGATDVESESGSFEVFLTHLLVYGLLLLVFSCYSA